MADQYTYELRSINLSSLPNDEALAVLSRFQTFLNSLSEPIVFHIVSDIRQVDVGGSLYTIPYKRFFIVSETQIDDIVGLLGAKFTRSPAMPKVDILRVNQRSMLTNDSDFVRSFTVSQLLGSIEIGFLSDLYDITHEIRLDITPYDILDSKNIAHKRSVAVGSKIIMRQAGGRSVDPEDQVMYERTMVTAQAIAAGHERLFSVIVTLTIKGKTYDALVETSKQLKRQMSGKAGMLDSPKYLQYPLYNHTGPNWAKGRSFYIPSSSLTTFFPFAGLDLTDPEGIMMGRNANTLNAVLYDIFDKENYNVSIMGMTGFGKCLAENSFVVLDDGRYLPISKVSSGSALSLNGTMKIEPQEISSVSARALRTNEKMVRVITRSGREVELTSNHPILTFAGWKSAGGLKINERIAVPRILPVFGKEEMPTSQVKLLAYLMMEDPISLTQSCPSFAKDDPELLEDIRSAMAEFSMDLALKPRSRINNMRYDLRDTKKYRQSMSNSVVNPLTNWLRSTYSYYPTKLVPDVVFTLKKPLLALFLNRLLSGAGKISLSKYQRRRSVSAITYSSNSKVLIHQVQHLLLRFGVLSYVRDMTKHGKGYKLSVAGNDNVEMFLREIGFFGAKSKLTGSPPRAQADSTDNIPKEVWAKLEQAPSIGRKGPNAYQKHNPSRQMLSRIAGSDPVAAMYANSDIFWDAVDSVTELKYTGRVYDLSLPTHHNFVAQDFIVHNSTFIKTFFSRLVRKYNDMIMFVFDSIVKPEYAVGPDGTYENSFAGLIGAKVHRYKLDEDAGLDPFGVFRKGDSGNSASDTRKAADFLASLAHIDEDQDLLADLYITSETCTSVEELIAKSPERLRKRLEASLQPFMFLFRGDFDVYDKMVFVLNDIPNAQVRDAAAFLTLAAVWQVIKEQPVARKKAIIIDEGWSLVEINPRTGKPYFQLAVEYVPEIARTGRHYNTCFTIATQLVSDFLGRNGQVGPGREMMESCATKVVLKQDQAAVEAIEQAFRVSDAEKRLILNQQIGYGLLMSPEGHVPFYNFMSDWEREVFTTRPKDVK